MFHLRQQPRTVNQLQRAEYLVVAGWEELINQRLAVGRSLPNSQPPARFLAPKLGNQPPLRPQDRFSQRQARLLMQELLLKIRLEQLRASLVASRSAKRTPQHQRASLVLPFLQTLPRLLDRHLVQALEQETALSSTSVSQKLSRTVPREKPMLHPPNRRHPLCFSHQVAHLQTPATHRTLLCLQLPHKCQTYLEMRQPSPRTQHPVTQPTASQHQVCSQT